LIACGQMATPVFAGTSPSQTDAGWQVGDGATLLVAGEPLLLEAGSTHAAGATFALAGEGRAIVVDTFALRGSARLSMRTCATLDGRLVYRDAYDVTGELTAAFGDRAHAVAAEAADAVRAGIGETSAAIVVRLHGALVWHVRAAALAIAGVTAP